MLRRIAHRRISQCLVDFIHSYSTEAACNNQHVCIVGSGPAGFYTAQQLLKGHPNINVDIYEKLPVPFGLVRFGVAPDHPEVKNVINTFTQTAKKERLSFIGNVTVGQDIRLSELQKAYNAVVMCYGADEDRKLGVPGEDLKNVLPARTFVGWYNGLPQDKDLDIDLSCEAAVVLGQGNVALDVARILLMPMELLSKTDIPQHVLDKLSQSKIKKVYLVGRRGPLQVAFTIKELREMTRLPETRPVIKPEDVAGLDKCIEDLPRPRRRLTELLYKTALDPNPKDVKYWEKASRECIFTFLRSPKEFIPSKDNQSVGSLRFTINRLEGSTGENQAAVATDETEDIPCGLVLRSIGYKSISIDDELPFDKKKGVIPCQKSRVEGKPGLYCSGWVGRGPVGVILGTMTDGFDTGKAILEDIKTGSIGTENKNGKEDIMKLLKERSVETVSFSDWEKIDELEQASGEKLGKPREKFVDILQMMKIAKS